MTTVLFTLAIVAAVVAMGLRRFRRSRLRRAAAQRSGSSPERAIHIRSYGEMDGHLDERWCFCGGFLERAGEGSRTAGGRTYRIARMRCQECEEPAEVYFDTTDVLH